MCVRAVFKISEHALVDFHSGSNEPAVMLTALAVRPTCHVASIATPALRAAMRLRLTVPLGCLAALLAFSGARLSVDAVRHAILRDARLRGPLLHPVQKARAQCARLACC